MDCNISRDSDEESFVILSTSPLPSLSTIHESASPSPPRNVFSITNKPLDDSQIHALRSAIHDPPQQSSQMANPIERTSMKSQLPQANQNPTNDVVVSKCLEDCAVETLLKLQLSGTESLKGSETSSDDSGKQTTSFTKVTPFSSANSSLATNFMIGEVNSDVLKTSVYSQFPSISTDACAEDVTKLQSMVAEYGQLKAALKKANTVMKQFYENSLQWKENLRAMEEQCKQQLNSFEQEIQQLKKRNVEMENNFKMQIEALEVSQKKDHEENIKEMSEKNALLDNMRAQIAKLEQQQLASFEFLDQGAKDSVELKQTLMTCRQSELKMKESQRQLSEMLAQNLDLKDLEKQYKDELTCLKVNLTAAEELIKKNHSEMQQLRTVNNENEEKIQTLENCLKSLRVDYNEQKVRISLLETQNEVYRIDFNMEKASRETAFKEKQQMIQDMRSLHQKNLKLIEEQRNLAKSLQTANANLSPYDHNPFKASTDAAQSHVDYNKRPIRTLPLPSPSKPTVSPPVAKHLCPICNKAFNSLHILLNHATDCVDKN